MARSSSPLGPPVVLATPPRLSPLRDHSDLEDLPDDPIPDTSPYVTQPTQVVSNPRTTLKRASPPPASDSSVSPSPPRQASKPPRFIPRRDHKISHFFPRSLPLSPKATVTASSSRSLSNGSRQKSVVPQKRDSDLIELSEDDEDPSDDDEDELSADRADINPTVFSHKVSNLIPPTLYLKTTFADSNASSLGLVPQIASLAKGLQQG